ncbi:MAG: class I SAM-dependent methyltransferase [Candidatus Saccharibacteria bacterium]
MLGKACPLCQSNRTELYAQYEQFSLFYCEECELVFNSKVLDRVEATHLVNEVYDDNWVKMRELDRDKTFLEHALFNIMLLNIFAPKGGDMLEIGSGTGEFLYAARAAGWNVTGFEPSRAACEYVYNKYGLELINSAWKGDLAGSSFDVIVFWHVLEHIADPFRFLQDTKKVLKKDGIILFSLPNKNAFINTIMGQNSSLFTEPDHLYHFSESNLRTLLERASLEVISLFSREESTRFLQDIGPRLRSAITGQPLAFEEQMGLISHLQSDFKGHELCCVVKPNE